ncbi:MAG: 16S rRNA (uracil(1498)-N(3))-methyltransferase [Deltaproteobacteria bacterium]|nr:MAG: 16S rRNA (uracil(1498)-N(3))-methyltransferase [Deltaproteobacteria bacterium]
MTQKHRFFVSPEQIAGGQAVLKGGELKHLRARRLRVGEEIELFDGQCKKYSARIIQESSNQTVVKITGIHQDTSPSMNIILGQALPKARKMDFIVQKATELGVSTIIPFCCNRAVPRYDEKKVDARVKRWRKIAREAAKQCGRITVPNIKEIISFRELLRLSPDFGLKFIPWEEERRRDLKGLLRRNRPSKDIFMVVGPEGGFAAEEISQAKDSGFVPVSLGKRVLRTETVALVLLSIIQFERGDLG